MEHLTSDERDLLAKARAATLGPYEVEDRGDDYIVTGNRYLDDEDEDGHRATGMRCCTTVARVLGNATSTNITRHNAEFIAAANPATVVKLLEELNQARGEAKRWYRRLTGAIPGSLPARDQEHDGHDGHL